MVDGPYVSWTAKSRMKVMRLANLLQVTNMQTGFTLKPWNYFDSLPSRHVREDIIAEKHRCAPQL